MANPLMALKECGWPAFLCLLFGGAGIAAGFIGMMLLLTKARRIAWFVGLVAALLGLSAIAGGLLGRQLGLARLESALVSADIEPALRDRIREVGTAEAGQCVTIGAGAGALPILFGLFGLGIGLLVRKKAAE